MAWQSPAAGQDTALKYAPTCPSPADGSLGFVFVFGGSPGVELVQEVPDRVAISGSSGPPSLVL
jgi:hypothetical protein